MCSLLLAFVVLNNTAIAQAFDTAPTTGITPSGANHPSFAKTNPPDVAAQWGTASPLPTGKCYEAAVYLDGKIYVFGGLGTDLRFDTKCYKYDVATGSWSSFKALPVQRALPSVQAVNGKIYIIGGYSATNPFTTQSPVLEYDPAADTYTTKTSMPFGCYGAGSFVNAGRIWILGGGTTGFSTSSNSIQIYDPAQDKWTFSLSLTPFQSWGSGVAAIGDQVLYVGGVRYSGGSGTFGAWSYKGTISGDDIVWAQIADYPGNSIMRHAAGTDGTKFYFAGGYDAGSQNSGPPSAKTFAYDPVASIWEVKEQKPTGVYFGSQMIFDGVDKLYIIGGNNTASTVTDAVEYFNVNAAGGPVAVVKTTTIDTWVKNGANTNANVDIANIGSAPLTWSAAVDAGSQSWLTLNIASGSVPAGDKSFIPMVLRPSGNGTHSGTVTVTTNDPEKQTITISVTIHVQDQDVDTDINVLMEEGTGTWCGYCPYGADSLSAVIARYPGRVFGISYHGGSATEPLQTPSTSFWTNIIKLTGWPQGSVQRTVFEGESNMALSRGAWNSSIGTVLATKRSPVSIKIASKSYDQSTKKVDLTVEVFFHRDLALPVRLNIAQVQDNMNYSQVFYPASGGSTVLYPYFHNHVLRQMIPSDQGEIISGGANVASQSTITKQFSFTSVDSTIGTSRFVIFAHVSDGSTFGEVLQSEELELSSFITDVTPLPVNASFALHQNYPNPFNPSTMISFDLPVTHEVTMIVTNIMGREVARLAEGVLEAGHHTMSFSGDGLPSGTYFLSMRAGSFQHTRTMTLMK